MKREAQLEFFIPRYGLGLVPRLPHLTSCGGDAPPERRCQMAPQRESETGIIGMAPAQRKWSSLGVSLIQFAERTILAYLVLLGVGSRANRSRNGKTERRTSPDFPHLYAICALPSGARASVGAFLGRQTASPEIGNLNAASVRQANLNGLT